ncbi:MAG TPA: 3-phosphoshikimate 1-carboxyvinyltransferase [Mycobacteriales bacterium]|nr:3-phosphoshikimate 1-carboxyvinyltransferase [Mycobacteriales bacterium]
MTIAGTERPAWPAPYATGPVRGTVRLPGSKSLTNRALVLAALSDGPSRVLAPLRARDTTLMAAGLAMLGAGVTDGADGAWEVVPAPLAASPATVDCGLAGTVARFLPALATLGSAPVRFTGDPRMSERPLGPLLSALRTLGAQADADAIPVTVTGPAHGGPVTIDASTSSQLVSGLLLAGAGWPEGLDLHHRGPPVPSGFHLAMTVRMLREHGIQVTAGSDRWQVAAGPLHARDRVIEPDLSSASAFLAAAAATGGEVTVPGWPAETDQPGALLPSLLEQMGCTTTRSGEFLTVRGPDRLSGLDADLRDCPELALTLAALATLASSESRLTGIAHLRLQESDRLAAIADQLGVLGARISVLADGGLQVAPAPLTAPRNGALDPHADHRLAMAYAVVGLAVPGVRIRDIATTAKTVPGFDRLWEDLVRG